LVAKLEEKATPGITLTHTSASVSNDITGVISHLKRGPIFLSEEACNRLIPLHDSREDRAMTHCVESFGQVNGDDSVFLAVRKISHTGTKLDTATEAPTGLERLESRSDDFADDV
jgi:hypothetical protein